jgi:polyisoprenoid-binding protein YceI
MIVQILLAATAASHFVVDKEQSSVKFAAVGKPGFLHINGESAKLGGTADWADGSISGNFTVALDGFVTGIDMRDEHMKAKYLETGKFPQATLAVAKVAAPGAGTVDFTGDLTLKGVTKPVKGTLTLKNGPADGKVEGDAAFALALTDFPVGVPTYMGITVADKVDVTAHFVATAAPAAH